jgi:hypothetical protein
MKLLPKQQIISTWLQDMQWHCGDKLLNQNNQDWDRQLFSGIEFVTKQIKNPEKTAYARSHDN